MLDDDTLAPGNGLLDALHQGVELRKAHLEAHIQVISMGRIEPVFLVLAQQGQGAHVDALVIVGQLQTGEHALDNHGLARTGLADDADDPVGGAEMLLGDLHAQLIHTVTAAGRGINSIQMVAGTSVERHRKASFYLQKIISKVVPVCPWRRR